MGWASFTKARVWQTAWVCSERLDRVCHSCNLQGKD